MLCPECGTLIKKGAKFCTNCGKPIPPSSNKNKIFAAVACVIAVLAFVLISVTVKENSYINKVKNAHPTFDDKVTYGMAFNRYFTDTEWQCMYDEENDENWVMFSGNAEYLGENVEHLVMFYFNEDGDEIEWFYFVVDNESFDDFDSTALMIKVFNDYSNESGGIYEGNNAQGYLDEYKESGQSYDENILDTVLADDVKVPNMYIAGRYDGIVGECSISIYSSPTDSEVGNATIDVEGTPYNGAIVEVKTNVFKVLTNDGRDVYLGVYTSGDYSVPENVVVRLYSDGEFIDYFTMFEPFIS